MKKAVALVRVSTEGQVDKYGLDAQLYDITEYAKNNDIELVKVFREEGVSGATPYEERFTLVNMLDYCKENPEINYVIVPELSRLARDVMIQEKIINDLNRWGVELISIKEPNLGAGDAYRDLIRQIMGAINEFERKMIAARMKAGRRAKARKGEHAVGQIPTGYKLIVDGNKKILEKDDKEAEVVRLIFKLREEEGMSYREIANYLNDHGYRSKNNKKFIHTSIRRIYTNPKYRGLIQYNADGKMIIAKNEKLRLVR